MVINNHNTCIVRDIAQVGPMHQIMTTVLAVSDKAHTAYSSNSSISVYSKIYAALVTDQINPVSRGMSIAHVVGRTLTANLNKLCQ